MINFSPPSPLMCALDFYVRTLVLGMNCSLKDLCFLMLLTLGLVHHCPSEKHTLSDNTTAENCDAFFSGCFSHRHSRTTLINFKNFKAGTNNLSVHDAFAALPSGQILGSSAS